MNVDDRIIHYLSVILEKTDYNYFFGTEDDDSSSFYNKVDEKCSSSLFSVTTPDEMIEYINNVIENRDFAACITAKVFYDMYECSHSSQTTLNEEDTDACDNVIPSYTYTL